MKFQIKSLYVFHRDFDLHIEKKPSYYNILGTVNVLWIQACDVISTQELTIIGRRDVVSAAARVRERDAARLGRGQRPAHAPARRRRAHGAGHAGGQHVEW